MCSQDGRNPLLQICRHWRRASGVHVNMDKHLLCRRQQIPGPGIVHRVKDVESLFVCIKQVKGQIEPIIQMRFGKIENHCLDREQRMARCAIGFINADEPEKRVRLVTKGQKIARLAHVAIIVDPLGWNGRADQSQGRFYRFARTPRSRRNALQRRSQTVSQFITSCQSINPFANQAILRIGQPKFGRSIATGVEQVARRTEPALSTYTVHYWALYRGFKIDSLGFAAMQYLQVRETPET